MKRRFEDDELIVNNLGKKLRLDNLFENLNINDKPLEINSPVNFPKIQFVPNLNTYLADKMMDDYKTLFRKDLQVIRTYNKYQIILQHFQAWILRLFNKFITNYNKFNFKKVPKFLNFNKLIEFWKLNNYDFQYLIEIILKESKLELSKIQLKFQDEKVEEIINYDEIRYNYWDKYDYRIDFDVEMVESDEYISD